MPNKHHINNDDYEVINGRKVYGRRYHAGSVLLMDSATRRPGFPRVKTADGNALSRGLAAKLVPRSFQELKDAIHHFLDDTNENPKPFTWTKDPNKIIAAVKRGHQVLDSIR
jgi:hypothetical protein